MCSCYLFPRKTNQLLSENIDFYKSGGGPGSLLPNDRKLLTSGPSCMECKILIRFCQSLPFKAEMDKVYSDIHAHSQMKTHRTRSEASWGSNTCYYTHTHIYLPHSYMHTTQLHSESKQDGETP